MTISWRAYAAGGDNSQADVTISVPTGTINGDMMIAVVGSDSVGMYDPIGHFV